MQVLSLFLSLPLFHVIFREQKKKSFIYYRKERRKEEKHEGQQGEGDERSKGRMRRDEKHKVGEIGCMEGLVRDIKCQREHRAPQSR